MDLQLVDQLILHVKTNDAANQSNLPARAVKTFSPPPPPCIQYVAPVSMHACLCAHIKPVGVHICPPVWSATMCLQAGTCSNNHITVKLLWPLNFQAYSVSRGKPSAKRSTARCRSVFIRKGIGKRFYSCAYLVI